MPPRHSPSIGIATLPTMNALLSLNSSPNVVRYFSSLWKPPSLSTSAFCHSYVD